MPLRADLIAYLEAPNEEFSVARLAAFSNEVALPPLLARQILERTTEREGSRAWLWPSVRGFFQIGSTPDQRSTHAARWGFGLAAPALAAWLLFIAQTSFVETSPTSAARAPIALPNSKIAAPKSAPTETVKKIAILPDAKKTAPATVDLSTNANPQILKTPARNVRAEQVPPVIAARVVEASFAPSKASRKNRVLKKLIVKRASSSRSRAIPLVDKTISIKPKLMRVALKPSVAPARLAAQHQDTNPRISTPVTPMTHAGTRLADLRFADADFDETLSAIARQRDNRPEDLGRALDEYSASLLAEHADQNDDEEWG